MKMKTSTSKKKKTKTSATCPGLRRSSRALYLGNLRPEHVVGEETQGELAPHP